jgi:hypothetical protein
MSKHITEAAEMLSAAEARHHWEAAETALDRAFEALDIDEIERLRVVCSVLDRRVRSLAGRAVQAVAA